MAAALKQQLGVDAELKPGPSGSFFVQVDGQTVIEKTGLQFPDDPVVVQAVRAKL